MDFLWSGLLSITWQQVVMYVVGLLLIYLAIEKNYEPALLLPMGFGAILVNLPASGVLNQFMEGAGETHGIIQWLFESGIEASEAFPLLLFIGIGAMGKPMALNLLKAGHELYVFDVVAAAVADMWAKIDDWNGRSRGMSGSRGTSQRYAAGPVG